MIQTVMISAVQREVEQKVFRGQNMDLCAFEVCGSRPGPQAIVVDAERICWLFNTPMQLYHRSASFVHLGEMIRPGAELLQAGSRQRSEAPF